MYLGWCVCVFVLARCVQSLINHFVDDEVCVVGFYSSFNSVAIFWTVIFILLGII